MTEELEGQCAAMREALERMRDSGGIWSPVLAHKALSSDAGRDLLERLRKAEKELTTCDMRHVDATDVLVRESALRAELERCKRSLDNSSSLLTAMLHECRPVLEIEAQLIENRIALSAMEASHE